MPQQNSAAMNECNVPFTGHNAQPPTSAKLRACWVLYQYRIILVKELKQTTWQTWWLYLPLVASNKLPWRCTYAGMWCCVAHLMAQQHVC